MSSASIAPVQAAVAEVSASVGAPKARKARSKNGVPSRPKPNKALLSLRELAHYARLKIALKQGARIKAPVILAEFCKPLVSVDEVDEEEKDEDEDEAEDDEDEDVQEIKKQKK
jgi:hypothetical protein